MRQWENFCGPVPFSSPASSPSKFLLAAFLLEILFPLKIEFNILVKKNSGFKPHEAPKQPFSINSFSALIMKFFLISPIMYIQPHIAHHGPKNYRKETFKFIISMWGSESTPPCWCHWKLPSCKVLAEMNMDQLSTGSSNRFATNLSAAIFNVEQRECVSQKQHIGLTCPPQWVEGYLFKKTSFLSYCWAAESC